jgi:hypothetical protein
VEHRQIHIFGRGDPQHPTNFHLLAPHDTAEECRTPTAAWNQGQHVARTGEVTFGSSDLEMPIDLDTGCEQEIGIRFERIYVPHGAPQTGRLRVFLTPLPSIFLPPFIRF